MLIIVLFTAIAGTSSPGWAAHGHGGGMGWSGGGGHGWSGGGHGWSGGNVHAGHFAFNSGFHDHFDDGHFHSGVHFNGWPFVFGYPYLYGYYNYPGYYYGYPSYYSSYPSDYYASYPSNYYAYGGPDYGEQLPPQQYVVSRPVADVARLEVRLPDPQANIWVQGKEISSSGAVRQFQSPQLEPMHRYTYTIKAEWNENGNLTSDERKVSVQADTQSVVDFTKPAPTAADAQGAAFPELPPPESR